ncbi:MAG: hypothetical protein R3Y58_13010, partial [Eubacteriales bacterium]
MKNIQLKQTIKQICNQIRNQIRSKMAVGMMTMALVMMVGGVVYATEASDDSTTTVSTLADFVNNLSFEQETITLSEENSSVVIG